VPTGIHRGFVRYGEPSGGAPPRAFDRRPTDRDVQQGEKCTRSTAVRRTEGADDAHAVRHATVQRHRRDTLNLPFFCLQALTKDSVTVTVDAVVYYKIQHPLNAVTKVANYSNSTRLLAMTTLRNILGTRNLSEILADREGISHIMQTSLDVATDPWGVKVERVEM
jgi:hypothetical protein